MELALQEWDDSQHDSETNTAQNSMRQSEASDKPLEAVVAGQTATTQLDLAINNSDHPKLWPLRTRIFHTALPALYGLTVTLSTSIYAPGVGQIAHKFGISREVAILGLSLYSEGLALGPIIGAPISEVAGRKAVYLITLPIFLLFTMGAGLAQNPETLIICRFFAAAFGSPALAVGAGTIADLWDMEHGGGLASILVTSTFFLGPTLGPLIGGYTIETRGSWRWLQWASLLAAGPVFAAAVFSKETYYKQIQKTRAKKLGLEPPPRPPPREALKFLLVVTLFRPLKMMVAEPIVAAWALYHAFIFGVLYAFFDSYYFIFASVYHFSLGQIGLAFLGIFIGVLLAAVTFAIVDKTIYQKKKRQFSDGKPPPEERLYTCMLGSIGVPVALFWFGWTARPDIHWIVPITAGIPFGWGTVCLMLGGMTYLIDTYGALYSASAIAANGIMRYTFGCAFPLVSQPMYARLGVAWATSLLAFISVGLLPIPFVLYKFGPALRSRSVFVGPSSTGS